MNDLNCSSCGNTLEKGSVATEKPEDSACWVKGQPTETDTSRPGVQRGIKRLPIAALRCPRCGRLELYTSVR